MRKKVLVIGLDGATWSIIQPLLDFLPTISQIVKEGTSGILTSSIPPRTFPAWKCYSTGKNPGKLGVFDFFSVDVAQREVKVCNSKSFKSQEIWDIMGQHGFSVCIINMPTTYPPKSVNGVLIGGPFSAEVGYTFPPGMEKKLRERHNYVPFIDQLSFEINRDETIRKAIKVIKTRFDVAINFLKGLEPDFMHVTVFLCDMIQHFGSHEEVEKAWIFIDSQIKRLLNLLDESWTIFLMSDHGFAELIARVNINTFLKKKGFLSTKSKWFSSFLNGEILYRVAEKTGFLLLIKKIIPRYILRKIGGKLPLSHGKLGPQGVIDSILWDKTSAFYSGACIYLTEKGLVKKDRIIRELKKLIEPKTGKKVFLDVYSKDDIYLGNYMTNAPDIIPVANDGFELSSSISSSLYEYSFPGWRRDHSLYGLIAAFGIDINRNKKVNANIIDLAPTILHIFGLPIPYDMDGKILFDIFKKESSFES